MSKQNKGNHKNEKILHMERVSKFFSPGGNKKPASRRTTDFYKQYVKRLITLLHRIPRIPFILMFHSDNASYAFPFEHVVEGLVDLRERDLMSDELLQFKFLVHIFFYNSRNV